MTNKLPIYKNNQEVFDLAVKYFNESSGKCVDPDTDSCMYYTSCTDEFGNIKEHNCVVGSMIPNNINIEIQTTDGGEAELEDMSIWDVVCQRPDVAAIFQNVNKDMLSDLQNIHDGCWNKEAVYDRLCYLPEEFCLDAGALKDFNIEGSW